MNWNPDQGAIIREGLRRSPPIAMLRGDRSPAFRRLHASRMPFALEQLRELLGLSVSWLDLWTGGTSAERPGHIWA